MAWARRPQAPRWRPVGGYPAGPRAAWDPRQLIVVVLVVLILVAFSFILFPGSSDLRWFLLSLVLVLVGALVFLSLYRSGAKMPLLQPPRKSERPLQGRLSRLADVLERADRGMRFSQASVARRVRRAFLDRLQTERNLGEEELAAVLASRTKLEEVVGDPVIRAFLEDTAPAEEGRPELSLQDPSEFRFIGQGGYTRGLARVLAAMEAWK